MPRLFVGLEIPAEIQQPLSFLRGGLPGARWIDPENYHITLRFIGDIDDRLAGDIALTLAGVRRRSLARRGAGAPAFRGGVRHVDAVGGKKAARDRRVGGADPAADRTAVGAR